MLKILRIFWNAISDFDSLLSIGKWGIWKVVGAFMTGAITIFLTYLAYIEDRPRSIIVGGGFILFVAAITLFFLIIPIFFCWIGKKLKLFENRDLDKRRLFAALEFECLGHIAIYWSPAMDSSIIIKDGVSQASIGRDWKLKICNTKKEAIRSFSIK